MTSPTAPVPIERLLAHREWVRHVARAMVRDENDADDLEQGLWLDVLQRPPRSARSLRGWLFTSLRRDRTDRRRSESARVLREESQARAEAIPAAEELVAKADVHKRVVVAVMDLDEPYRSTILYRFFEGLPPSVIAARQGVSVETVRTRLRRALERLRDGFRRDLGADAWISALAPFAELRLPAATGASSATVAGVAGGTTMGAKATWAAAVGLVLVTGLAGGRISAAGANAKSEERIAALVQRVDALRPPVPTADAPSQPDRARAASDERGTARALRLDALEAELAAIFATAASRPADVELDRLTALGTPELLVEGRRLVKVARYTRTIADAEAVLRICGLLLARPVESEQRAEARILQGQGHGVLGDDAAEETSFRQAMTEAGAASEQTRNAMTELRFAAGRRGDSSVAAEWSLRLADWHFSAASRATTAADRAHRRYYVGIWLAHANEVARARDEHRAVVDEFGASDDKDVRKWADFSRKELAKLDGAAGTPEPSAPPPGRSNGAR